MTAYGDAVEAVRDIALDEGRKFLIANTSIKFTVYNMIPDRKYDSRPIMKVAKFLCRGFVLVEVDAYLPPVKGTKIRFVKFSTLHEEVIYCIEEKARNYLELQVYKLTKRKVFDLILLMIALTLNS